MDFILFQTTRASIPPLFQAVRDVFSAIFTWVNRILLNFNASDGAFYSVRLFFVVPIAIAIIFFTIKFIKHVVWGA